MARPLQGMRPKRNKLANDVGSVVVERLFRAFKTDIPTRTKRDLRFLIEVGPMESTLKVEDQS